MHAMTNNDVVVVTSVLLSTSRRVATVARTPISNHPLTTARALFPVGLPPWNCLAPERQISRSTPGLWRQTDVSPQHRMNGMSLLRNAAPVLDGHGPRGSPNR